MPTAKQDNNRICEYCRHVHPFELPSEIMEAYRQSRLVLFAGAGVSTEQKPLVFPYTFLDEIRSECGIERDTVLNFPQVMSMFASKTNGRRELLQRLKARLDYVASFPAIYGNATRFHRELSTIPHLDNIVTTNWDDYFETECGATPIAVPADFVFWNMTGRKVFKIHGSISNFSSIIATEDDYHKCYKDFGQSLVGSNLKMMLGTKTILFAGYSFRDPEFISIYKLLQEDMKGLLPRSYVIAIEENDAQRFRGMGLTPIITDAVHFLSIFKKHLVAETLMLSDERFGAILTTYATIVRQQRALHAHFSYKKNPAMIYCASYQDGVIHAFERILARMKTGEYSCPDQVRGVLRSYFDILKEKRRERRYEDVAYTEGYINGLWYLLATDADREKLPYFNVYGGKTPLRTLSQYKKECKRLAGFHKAAQRRAEMLAKSLAEGIVWRHTPFLF